MIILTIIRIIYMLMIIGIAVLAIWTFLESKKIYEKLTVVIIVVLIILRVFLIKWGKRYGKTKTKQIY